MGQLEQSKWDAIPIVRKLHFQIPISHIIHCLYSMFYFCNATPDGFHEYFHAFRQTRPPLQLCTSLCQMEASYICARKATKNMHAGVSIFAMKHVIITEFQNHSTNGASAQRVNLWKENIWQVSVDPIGVKMATINSIAKEIQFSRWKYKTHTISKHKSRTRFFENDVHIQLLNGFAH